MKVTFKRFALLTFLLGSLSRETWAAQEYQDFQKIAAEHETQLHSLGMSYMVGGSLGLASSLALGVTSKEVIPKIGYSLIQALSSAAIAYGGILYFTGDDLTREAANMREFSDLLALDRKITLAQRQTLLDAATSNSLRRGLEQRAVTRKLRGDLELITAASAGITLAFSQPSSTASNLTLGFIVLVAGIGGASDLLTEEGPANLNRVDGFISQSGGGLSYVLRW